MSRSIARWSRRRPTGLRCMEQRGAVELATPEVGFRFTPATEPPATSRHQAAPPEIVKYKGIHHSKTRTRAFQMRCP
jgi:hypothetical protein